MMREYTQTEIDEILSHDEIIDDEHKTKVYDLRYLYAIDYMANGKKYDIQLSKLNRLIKQAWEQGPQDERIEVLNVEGVMDHLDNEQGLRTFDYERNIWRVAYTFKSIQLSEEEARQGEKPTKPNDLIENFTSDNLKAFKETYNRLINIYVTTQAVIGFLRILKQAVGLQDIQRVMDKFELDLELMDIVRDEAETAEIYIYLHYVKKTNNADISKDSVTSEVVYSEMKERLQAYKDLLEVPDLREYTLNENDYIRIASKYEELPHAGVIHAMTQITKDFKGVMLDE